MRFVVFAAALALLTSAPASAQVDATIRTEADQTRTMTHVVVIPAAPEQVWQAISTIDGWKSWAVPNAWALPDDPDSFETSYALDGKPGAPANITNRFIARLPGRIAVFSTVRTPNGFPHAAEYRRVVSFFEVLPGEDGGSIVRLTGTGYPAGAAGDMLIGFFRGGNTTSLEALKDRFVRGPIDWATKLAAPKR